MKKLKLPVFIILLLILAFQTNGFSQANESNSKCFEILSRQKITFTLDDSWFGRDKVHHFLSSAFLTTAGYYFCKEERGFSNYKSQQGGISFSLSLGLLKEIRDGRKPNNAFSVKDLVADILGTVVGVLIVSD